MHPTKAELIARFLETADGRRKIATSMERPLLLHIGYATPWGWSHRETSEPFDGRRLSSGVVSYRIEGSDRSVEAIERMMDVVRRRLLDALATPWFDHLRQMPVTGGLEEVGAVFRPDENLVWVLHPSGRQGLGSNPKVAYTAIDSVAYTAIDSDHLWVVSRYDADRGPFEVRAHLAEDGDGHLRYDFEARVMVSRDMPRMARFTP